MRVIYIYIYCDTYSHLHPQIDEFEEVKADIHKSINKLAVALRGKSSDSIAESVYDLASRASRVSIYSNVTYYIYIYITIASMNI